MLLRKALVGLGWIASTTRALDIVVEDDSAYYGHSVLTDLKN